jgi:hypothetical protein
LRLIRVGQQGVADWAKKKLAVDLDSPGRELLDDGSSEGGCESEVSSGRARLNSQRRCCPATTIGSLRRTIIPYEQARPGCLSTSSLGV